MLPYRLRLRSQVSCHKGAAPSAVRILPYHPSHQLVRKKRVRHLCVERRQPPQARQRHWQPGCTATLSDCASRHTVPRRLLATLRVARLANVSNLSPKSPARRLLERSSVSIWTVVRNCSDRSCRPHQEYRGRTGHALGDLSWNDRAGAPSISSTCRQRCVPYWAAKLRQRARTPPRRTLSSGCSRLLHALHMRRFRMPFLLKR